MNKYYDIILIIPPCDEDYTNNNQGIYEHLGVEYLLSSLPDSIKSTYIDAFNTEYSLEYIVDFLKRHNVKIVGLSCNFNISIGPTIKIAEFIKESLPSIHITCGGHGIVPCKEQLLNLGIVDSICLCEGEECFPNFATKLLNKESFEKTNGMWFNINGNIIKNQYTRLIKHLDDIAWPSRTEPIFQELFPEKTKSYIHTVISSRGCPYQCSFCDIKTFYGKDFGKSWRMRSAIDLVNEIQFLIEDKDATYIFIGDDNFIGSCQKGIERVYDFCKLMKERNLTIYFGIEARVTDINSNIISALKDVGLISVMIGVENASNDTLKRWNKKITMEDSIEAIRVLDRFNIDSFINYILYDMYTTIEDLEESISFFKKTGIFRKEYPINLYNNKIGLFLGSEITEEMKNNYLVRKKSKKIGNKGFILTEYSYVFEDNRMELFEKLQKYWLSKIEHIRLGLDKTKRQKFDKTCGLMLLKNFEICVEQSKIDNTLFQKINETYELLNINIDKYLKSY